MDREKLLKFYVQASKLFEAGYSKVLWRFNSVFQVLLVFSTFMILKGYDFGWPEYLFMAGFVVVVIFGAGYVYLRFGFFKADQEAIFSENQIILDIQGEVSEIKQMLRKLEK